MVDICNSHWLLRRSQVMFCVTLLLIFIFSLKANAQNYSDSITVNLFMLDECKISQNMTKEINTLYESFHGSDIHFVAYFPNFSSKPDNIEAFKEKFKLQMECKTDYFKSRSKKLGARVAPEVVVYDEKKEAVLYKGRIDNSYDKIGSRRRVITKRDLFDALTAIKSNTLIEENSTEAIGCFINFKELE